MAPLEKIIDINLVTRTGGKTTLAFDVTPPREDVRGANVATQRRQRSRDDARHFLVSFVPQRCAHRSVRGIERLELFHIFWQKKDALSY